MQPEITVIVQQICNSCKKPLQVLRFVDRTTTQSMFCVGCSNCRITMHITDCESLCEDICEQNFYITVDNVGDACGKG